MNNRLKLQQTLEEILWSTNVYYQPPETLKLQYPCIIYNRVSVQSTFASNMPYVHNSKYTLTFIDKRPDSPAIERILRLPTCVHDRHFVKDNLNHDVFTLYF